MAVNPRYGQPGVFVARRPFLSTIIVSLVLVLVAFNDGHLLDGAIWQSLWEASGVPYSELINRLIELAIERFEREEQLKTSF